MVGHQGSARRALAFLALEWLTNQTLIAMARIAARTGDLHELRHIGAQIHAGESVDCGPGCPLRFTKTRSQAAG